MSSSAGPASGMFLFIHSHGPWSFLRFTTVPYKVYRFRVWPLVIIIILCIYPCVNSIVVAHILQPKADHQLLHYPSRWIRFFTLIRKHPRKFIFTVDPVRGSERECERQWGNNERTRGSAIPSAVSRSVEQEGGTDRLRPSFARDLKDSRQSSRLAIYGLFPLSSRLTLYLKSRWAV